MYLPIVGSAVILFLSLLPALGRADEGFSAEITEPSLRVIIPGLPKMSMGRHPLAETHPYARLAGVDGAGTTVSILLPTADRRMAALECAASSLAATANRYGLARDKYVAATLNETTFAMLFVVPKPDFLQLQAFLFSAAGGTHCVEVHASRLTQNPDDVVAWRKSFEGALISQP